MQVAQVSGGKKLERLSSPVSCAQRTDLYSSALWSCRTEVFVDSTAPPFSPHFTMLTETWLDMINQSSATPRPDTYLCKRKSVIVQEHGCKVEVS